MRLLWLTYERPPHPDAVIHPIDADMTEFVIGILRSDDRRRLHLTEQLATYLASQDHHPLEQRQPVPCRTPSGIYRLVPWRLAKWLRHVLPASESTIRRTIARIEQWQTNGSQHTTLTAGSGSV